jgi:hypothetical protein
MFLFYLLFKQINIEVYNLASGGPKRQTECMQLWAVLKKSWV